MKITKTKQIKQSLVVVTVIAAMFAVGCELIVDFDRTKIPVEVSETSVPDVNIPDTSNPTTEGGTDGGQDADATSQSDADTLDAADADGG